PPRLRIQALEDVLIYERFALNEADSAVAALPEPQVTVASDIDQSFDGPPVALVIHQNRRGNLVPIPGVVRLILEMPLDRPRCDVDRDGRGSIEIIARTPIAHPGAP